MKVTSSNNGGKDQIQTFRFFSVKNVSCSLPISITGWGIQAGKEEEMIKTIDELLKKIELGLLKEHTFTNVELKRSWEQRHGEKISALANKVENEVSWMVIGVENNGQLAGYNESLIIKEEEKVSQHVNNYLDPIQACIALKSFDLNGSWIIVIKIANPGAVVKWDHKAYKRAGTTSVEMKPDEVMELTIKLPGLTDFSKQQWDGPIDNDLVRAFSVRLREHGGDFFAELEESNNSRQLLISIKVKNTNTEGILFGDYQYRVVFYDINENPVKNLTRSGLYSLLTDEFISEIEKWAFPSCNVPKHAFPVTALKEGLANAVAHAAYFEHYGEIIIEIFKDKVIISNLCLPESIYFANKWFSRSHKTVNGLLMETLRLVGRVDELGRGKNIIFVDSIKNGKKPPYVSVEKAGRYARWRLCIYGGITNSIQLRLFNRIKEVYPDEHKALIAYALVLWSNQPVSAIRNYIDSEAVLPFAEVLGDSNGPIFFYEKDDRIVLQRWVRVLLEEGKDSKSFTAAEEEQLYKFSYDIQTKYHDSLMTSKEFRKLAHMGDTKSEIVLSSTLLKKWVGENKLEKVKKGVYRFKSIPKAVELSRLIELLRDKQM